MATGDPCVETKTTLDIEHALHMPGGNIFHGPLSWPFAEDDADLSPPGAALGRRDRARPHPALRLGRACAAARSAASAGTTPPWRCSKRLTSHSRPAASHAIELPARAGSSDGSTRHGNFDNVGRRAAGGDWAKQAAEAQAMADQMMKDSGYGATTADAAAAAPAMAADRAALEAQADEQNRILTVGGKAKITIVSKTDPGKKVAGNDTYLLELKVEPEGGKAYTVKKEEIIPAAGDQRLRRRHHHGRARRPGRQEQGRVRRQAVQVGSRLMGIIRRRGTHLGRLEEEQAARHRRGHQAGRRRAPRPRRR